MVNLEDLGPDHMIRTLMEEHQTILDNLDQLRLLNVRIQGLEFYDEESLVFKKLNTIAANLKEAECHHQREEEVLFPKMEDIGINGPPAVMKMEHEEMKVFKYELLELCKSAGSMDFIPFKSQLNRVVNSLANMLEAHIQKEDNILYPCALNDLDSHLWHEMKDACDSIGYCKFDIV